MVLEHLRRVRWAVRATLLLGVAASVVANVLHALDNPISQAIAAWPPLALLLTVELISRVPVHRRLLAAARLIATATIAGIAAWVSYWHMAGVAARYGETGASPYLLPLSVDGLIVVASICLVELAGRISALENAEPATPAPTAAPATPAPAAPAAAVPAVPARAPAAAPAAAVPAAPAPAAAPAAPELVPTPLRRTTAAALAEVAAALPRSESTFTPAMTRQARKNPTNRMNGPTRTAPAQRTAGPATSRPAQGGAASHPGKKATRRSPAETVAIAARIKAERPSLTETEVAAELGISPSRWRTVRREAAQAADHTLAA